MGKAIVRLKDIAEKTGFSTNTDSLALRGSARIPEVTRQRITEIAVQLNYLPNQIAKSLVSKQTQIIGLVLTDLTNPVLTRAAQAIEVELAALGYGTLFASSNNNLEEEKRVIAMFRSRQVDGMLIYPARHRHLDHILPLRRANYPIVLLAGDGETGLDTVGIDDARGAQKAVHHLIDRGHRRIGFLDHGAALGNLEKLTGFTRAMDAAGLPVDHQLVKDPGGDSAPAGMAGMQRLMAVEPRPTAVFAANDSLAIGALRWCQINQLRVPQDVAIIGFDNIDFTSFAGTPLSTVNYAIDSLSHLAVDLLMQLIAAGTVLPPPVVTRIEPELIVRESTAY